MMYCVSITQTDNGPQAACVTELSDRRNFDDVVFFCWNSRGEDRDGPRDVCEAVSGVINHHLLGLQLPQPLWGRFMGANGPGLDLTRGSYYTYVYSDPDDPYDSFYCGKGRGGRWRAHFDVAQRLNRGEAVDATDTIETAKLNRIRRHLNETPNLQAEDLCRVIAAFHGPHAEAQSFAAEQYLIQGAFGVFNLTNLNGGQGRDGGLRWQSRPKDFDGNPEAMGFWRGLLERGLANGIPEFSVQDKASLIRHQIPGDLMDRLAALVRPLTGRPDTIQWLPLGISPEGDLSIEANVLGTPTCLQLVFGWRDLECRINLRPGPRVAVGDVRRETFEAFANYVTAIWPNAKIRNRRKHPYLKPFAPGQVGIADVDFSMADLTATSAIKNCLVFNEQTYLSLPEAVGRLVNMLQRQN